VACCFLGHNWDEKKKDGAKKLGEKKEKGTFMIVFFF